MSRKAKGGGERVQVPQLRVVKRTEVPPERPLTLDRDFWDSVVRNAAALRKDEALQLDFNKYDFVASGVRSSVQRAGRRAGLRTSVAIRGAMVNVFVETARARRKK